jgi:hypothetical protein
VFACGSTCIAAREGRYGIHKQSEQGVVKGSKKERMKEIHGKKKKTGTWCGIGGGVMWYCGAVDW